MRLASTPIIAVLLNCFSVSCYAQKVPTTKAKALDGSEVEFPAPRSRKPLVLVVGFSHKSSDQTEEWDKRLAPLYLTDSNLEYYEVADFQGVPSLVMRMILHGMRREVPANEHSHFVLMDRDEQEWEKLVSFSAPGDAYLIVSDAAGHVEWQTHGAETEAQFKALQAAVQTALRASK